MSGLVDAFKQRPWVRRVLAAWKRLTVTNGNVYAAAITYFSFLALFPLLLLAVAIAGFVLHSHPAALRTLFDKVASNAPGGVGKTLRDSIKTAIDERTGVGLIGLAGVLLTGLGWIGNLRTALDAVWQTPAPKQNPIKQRLVNLGILGGLGLGILLSLGLTAGWAAFTHDVLSAIGLDGVPGMGTLLGAIGVLVTLAGDVVIFFFVLVRLPHADVSRRAGVRGALLAAVGFEVLKIVGTYTIAASAGSATAGPFAGILAVLIWIQLVTRYLLFCAAWTAERTLGEVVPPPRVRIEADTDEPAPLSPAAVGAGLVGVGAVAGAAVTALVVRRAHGRYGRPRRT